MWIGFPAAAAHAADMIELDDVQLDQVTAGASEIDATEELLTFAVTKTTASGRTVTADGSFRLVEALDPATVGNLILSGQSQSNLRALININAVNSEINLLLNLNISIDSTVGTLNQFNLNGVLPVAALPTP
jgi:hypothetical protein